MAIEVVCAVIINEKNEILITKRSKNDIVPNDFEFPGGKVEANETFTEAVKREIREELCVDIEVKEFFFKDYFDYVKFDVNLNFCMCQIVNGEISLTEHTEMKWVSVSELKDYPILKSNLGAIEKLGDMYE